MKNVLGLLTVLTLSISSAYAADEFVCDAISPNLQALGEDKYYDFDTKPEITREVKKNLTAFHKAVKGKWSGTIKEIECKGAGERLRQEIDEGTAKVDISSSGEVLFKVATQKRFENKRIKTSRNQTYELFNGEHVFDIIIAKNTISASEKYRRKNDLDFTNLFENISSFTYDENGLEVIVTYYVNTVAVHQDVMMLKRDR